MGGGVTPTPHENNMEEPKGQILREPEGWVDPPVNPILQAIKDGESSSHFKMEDKVELYNESLHQLKNVRSTIDLKKDPNLLVSTWALFAPMRFYVIKKIKAPLQKAIERATRLKDISSELFFAVKNIPEVTKKNTCFKNTHILIDKKQLFNTYHNNPGRHKLTEAAFNLDIFEYEHDGYYAFIQDWMLIELAMDLARGDWVPRFTKFPVKHCWNGPDLPDVETIRQNLREALNE